MKWQKTFGVVQDIEWQAIVNYILLKQICICSMNDIIKYNGKYELVSLCAFVHVRITRDSKSDILE